MAAGAGSTPTPEPSPERSPPEAKVVVEKRFPFVWEALLAPCCAGLSCWPIRRRCIAGGTREYWFREDYLIGKHAEREECAQ